MQIVQFSLFAAAMAASVNSANVEQRDIDECTSAANELVEVMSDMPTADKTLASFIAQQTGFEDVADSCVIPAVTGSMAAAYTAYAKSMESWVSEMKDDLSSVYDACKDVPKVQEQLDSYKVPISGMCSSYAWATASATEIATATAKATDSAADLTASSTTKTASSTSTPNNVAENSGVRSTGLGAIAVVAIAGLAVAGAN
ncbi:hypothetical protein FVEN_g9489 [Fusarium venenatum]|uniref:Infection structure specific protein n=1 Tax=Fusarium venenatum TaxID=56646 RepID=A0A2L2TZ87_9HYPO|nr:uncharacterized protein FVRRES_04182 [Fusarium venenatum]KAG8352335.1 hypothetical protein FVEN_g9489 [Fusarium venenatum]KAH7002863.1 hypothetical protein EDB82DRAFT_438159 [Fusarium venenatum]CEI67670.1 unnamed protein product [Fusarium venenatum]